jgi:hypothetical protein
LASLNGLPCGTTVSRAVVFTDGLFLTTFQLIP